MNNLSEKQSPIRIPNSYPLYTDLFIFFKKWRFRLFVIPYRKLIFEENLCVRTTSIIEDVY